MQRLSKKKAEHYQNKNQQGMATSNDQKKFNKSHVNMATPR
jgi:hypothetical protein